MSNNLRKSVFENMQFLSTEELIDIWIENNPEEWTPTAFEVIEEILKARGKTLPKQKLASEILAEKEENNELVEDNEEENPPAFYEPQQVLSLSSWANPLSYIIAGTTLLIAFIEIACAISFDPYSTFYMLQYLFTILAKAGVQALFYFIVLQAIKKGLLILMEFEFNSR